MSPEQASKKKASRAWVAAKRELCRLEVMDRVGTAIALSHDRVNLMRNRMGLRLWVAAATAVLCLAACGSDDSSRSKSKAGSQGPSTPSSTGTSQAGPTGARDQPTGSLSPEEYRLMARAMTTLKRSNQIHSVKKSLEQFGRACKVLAAPPTPLLKASYDDCLSTVAFFEQFASVPRTLRSCGAPVTQASFTPIANPDLACFKRVLGAIREGTQASLKTSTAVNKALAERQIHGRCRRLIGTSSSDLRSLSEVAAATDDLDQTTDSPNRQRINKAVKRLEGAVEKLLTGPDEDPLKLLRACRA
jgi:hypothetical protein